MDVFESIVRQNIDKALIPYIKECYKKGWSKTIPSKIEVEKVVLDFSKVTIQWLTDTFHQITSDRMNCETIENVKINEHIDKLSATFDVNSDYGLHRGCGLTINKMGYVKVDLDDTPLDGCGVESDLICDIEDLIKQ